MTSTTTARERAARAVETLSTSIPNIYGCLLASPDGRSLASALPDHDPRSTAAIVASSKGLGERLAELSGTGLLEEIVVRSSSGYVIIYSVSNKGALTVLARPSVNVALVHLRARDTIDELVQLIDDIDVE